MCNGIKAGMHRLGNFVQWWRGIFRIPRRAKPDAQASPTAATSNPAVQGSWPKAAEFTRYSGSQSERSRRSGNDRAAK